MGADYNLHALGSLIAERTTVEGGSTLVFEFGGVRAVRSAEDRSFIAPSKEEERFVAQISGIRVVVTYDQHGLRIDSTKIQDVDLHPIAEAYCHQIARQLAGVPPALPKEAVGEQAEWKYQAADYTCNEPRLFALLGVAPSRVNFKAGCREKFAKDDPAARFHLLRGEFGRLLRRRGSARGQWTLDEAGVPLSGEFKADYFIDYMLPTIQQHEWAKVTFRAGKDE